MKEGYSIDRNGKRKVLRGKEVYCWGNHLTELVLPEGCEWVGCWRNHLTELALPEGCKWVECEGNHLTELIIPKGCEWVDCDYIPKVVIPEGCRIRMFLNIRL